jgi:hypothetical protein
MNNSLRSLPKLGIGLIVGFLLTVSNIWPVWQYNDDSSVQVPYTQDLQ